MNRGRLQNLKIKKIKMNPFLSVNSTVLCKAHEGFGETERVDKPFEDHEVILLKQYEQCETCPIYINRFGLSKRSKALIVVISVIYRLRIMNYRNY